MSLAKALRKTQRYFSFFGYTPTLTELHRWLISSKPYSLKTIKALLPGVSITRPVSPIVHHKKALAAGLVNSTLKHIPTIQMVALTGSVAANNAKKEDDIDLMFVTSANTLWLTRPLVVFLLKLRSLRRPPCLPEHSSLRVNNLFCDNLWLDETALSLPTHKRSLYSAHEILQAIPLFDKGHTHQRFVSVNSWVSGYLKNAYLSHFTDPNILPRPASFWKYILSPLNRISFWLQYHYMKPKITTEDISLHAAYFHPSNPSQKIDNYLQ